MVIMQIEFTCILVIVEHKTIGILKIAMSLFVIVHK